MNPALKIQNDPEGAEAMTGLLPSFLDRERVLSVKQSAMLLGVSITTFRRLYRSGQAPNPIRITVRKLGWRVHDLLNFINEHKGTST